MKGLFDPVENNLIKERIRKLTPASQPLWGKMNVSQMLAHLQPVMRVAFGQLRPKGGLVGLLFGKMAKKQLLVDKPFKKGLPTMKEFKVSATDFETEKNGVLSCVDRFITEGPGVIVNKKHPFFGELTLEEWNALQWKHLDHHLRQFGV
jgi:Protein of unknown function (DUF1569)